MEYLLLCAILLVIVNLYWYYRKYRHFPPGPIGIPVLGYLPFLENHPSHQYGELAKKYGHIFSLKLGSFPVVILNDFETIRKAFRQDVFAGRPRSILAMSITSDGISFNEGTAWYQQRRFMLKTLRELGFGRSTIESSIQEEVQRSIAHLNVQTNKPISLKHIFEISVINTLWSIVANKKYALDDPDVLYMHKICYEGFIEPEVAGAVWFMPWLAKLAPKWTGFRSLEIATEKMKEIFEQFIQERKKSYSPDNLNDFVDIYFKQIHDTNDPTSSFYKETGFNSLTHVLIDLFTAGSDTTSSTLSWAILYLMHYPHVLGKLRSEIQNVVGRDILKLSDRIRMPYAEATISEVFRMSSIVSGALLHSTTEDCKLDGYHLPKGTIVMANLWHVHHNPEHWKDALNFRPERFIDSNGNFRKDEHLIPFGIGKRICPAEHLATSNFFLFLTSLVQNFNFELEPGQPLQNLDPKPGLVLSTQPYNVILTSRKL